jgi:hypothetical protein
VVWNKRRTLKPETIQKMMICSKSTQGKALAVLAALVGCLLLGAGCMPPKPQAPPLVTYPSVVVTRAGVAFYVNGLRIPGTRQDLRLKEGDSITWVPLEQVSVVRFSGPIHDNYRSAIIILTGDERLLGDVFVDFLIEGTTDMGYWNMSMRQVESLEMGFD